MNKKNKPDLEELKKEIVIERLRQTPPNVKISFGMSDGRFLDRDELIEQVQNNTEIGKKIVIVQLEYLKAFKEGFAIGE